MRRPPPPEERPNIWKADGNAKLTEGDYKGALQSYTRGIEAAKEVGLSGNLLSQLYSNRAQAHSKLNDHEKAVDDCESAVKHDPNNGKAYWRGANAAMKAGKAVTAADLCTRGIEAVGDSQGLQTLLDEANAQQEAEAKEAESGLSRTLITEDLQQVISTKDLADRGASLLQRYRQAAEAERDEDDAVRARRIFEKVLVQDRKNEIALLGLGEILDEGLGCEKDPGRASQLWMVAVNAGSVKAQVKMALSGLTSWSITLRAQAMDHREAPEKQQAAPQAPQEPRRWRPGDKL